MKNKKLIARIIIIACSTLVVFTFFSKTVYTLSLADVQTVLVNNALITASSQTEGQIVCEDTVVVKSGENWTVESVLVKNGQLVNKGDLLLTTDMGDWELSRMTKELEILRLENSLAALDEAYGDVKTAELYAPFSGRLLSAESITVGGKLTQNALLGRFIDDSAFLLTVYFIEPYKDKIRVGMAATVTLPEWMSTVDGTVEAVSETVYAMDGIRVFSVDVRIGNPGALTEGAVAVVELKAADLEVMLPVGQGMLRYAGDELLYAPMNGIVSECLIQTGARYNKNDVILKVQEENRSEDGRNVQRSRSELIMQLEIAKKQLVRYEEPHGAIYAEIGGYVTSLSVKNGDHSSAGAELLRIVPEAAPLEANFTISVAEGKDYNAGTPVKVKFYTAEADNITERTCITQISERTLSDDGRSFTFLVSIDEYDGYPLMEVSAEIHVNGAGNIYDIVVPASCVTDKGDGKSIFVVSKRQGLFGLEYYVKEYQVVVAGGNAYQTALEPGTVFVGMEVIVYASRPLSDGEVVMVNQT